MVDTIKFSEFGDGGDLEPNQTTVGLEGGVNVRFSNPFPLLPPGTTAERPAIDPAMYYRLRFNTTLGAYEYYSPVEAAWVQLTDSVVDVLALLASHANGEGASLVGIENQGIVLNKTVQDFNNAPILAKTNDGTIPNGLFINALASGLLRVETVTGDLTSLILTGTANQITVTNGDGGSNPVFSLPAVLIAPGTVQVGNIKIDTNTISSENTDGDIIIAPDGTGNIDLDSDSVLVGSDILHKGNTDNKITFGADTQGFLTGAQVRLDISDLGIRLGGANARVTTILADGTMTAASDTNLYTGLAIKTYIDDKTAQFHFLQPARVASTADFDATYDNGTAGVGATLTANANGAAQIDGVNLSLNDRVLFKNQTDTFENGIYEVTQVGDGSNPAIYTRTTDFDTPSEIQPGDIVVILEGTVNENTAWLQTATVATIGTDPITFVSFIPSISNVVTITGTQTITGSKTLQLFSGTLDGTLDADTNTIDNVGQLNVDNLRLDGNTLSSTDTDGNINLLPDGNGELLAKADPVSNLGVATKQYVDNAAGGGSTTLNVNQATHGLSVGDWVYIDGAGDYLKAQADAVATSEAVGIVIAVADVDNFTLQFGGRVTAGLSGLTPGAIYYISDATAGEITATAPSDPGDVIKQVLVATSATTGFITNMLGVEI